MSAGRFETASKHQAVNNRSVPKPSIPTVVLVDRAILERIVEATPLSHCDLSRKAFAKYPAAQMKTAWAVRHRHAFALVRGDDLLASADAMAQIGRQTSNGGYDQVELRLDLGDSSELHFQLPSAARRSSTLGGGRTVSVEILLRKAAGASCRGRFLSGIAGHSWYR